MTLCLIESPSSTTAFLLVCAHSHVSRRTKHTHNANGSGVWTRKAKQTKPSASQSDSSKEPIVKRKANIVTVERPLFACLKFLFSHSIDIALVIERGCDCAFTKGASICCHCCAHRPSEQSIVVSSQLLFFPFSLLDHFVCYAYNAWASIETPTGTRTAAYIDKLSDWIYFGVVFFLVDH